jgi:hypothetical protein
MPGLMWWRWGRVELLEVHPRASVTVLRVGIFRDSALRSVQHCSSLFARAVVRIVVRFIVGVVAKVLVPRGLASQLRAAPPPYQRADRFESHGRRAFSFVGYGF